MTLDEIDRPGTTTPSHGAPLGSDGEVFRRLWETSTDAILIIDQRSKIVAASPAVEPLFGYTPDELLGQQLEVLQPERFREAHHAAMRRLLETGQHRQDWRAVQLYALHRDGHEFPVEISFSDSSAGGTRLYAGLVRDISSRLRAEQALRQSEARYRTLAENAFDMVCELGADGRFVYVSPNFKQILGYEPQSLIGASPFEMIHPDDRQRVAEQFAGLITSEREPGGSAFRYLRTDGSWCWLEVSANIFETPEGARHAVIVARDVTESHEMSRALAESEERLRTFVQNAPMIIFATDRDGVFTLLEGRELASYGMQPGQYVGQRLQDVFAAHSQFFASFQRTISGETFVEEVQVGQAHLQVHNAPVRDEQGDVTGMIGIVTDITERLRAQSLIASQRHLLEMIAVGATVEDVLQGLVESVESHAPSALCSILLTSSDGTRLHVAAAPSLPDAYNRVVEGLPIGPEVGSCGTAAYRNEPVIVSDIEHDPLWHDGRDVALSHGLRACWSYPIASTTGTVLGTLAVYYREPRAPTSAELELVRNAAHIAGIAIERRRGDHALRSRTAELERMYKRLTRTHADLEDSKRRLEEKSRLLEIALESERERSRRDQLTGALNHAAITDVLRDVVELKPSHPHAIAMVDVDGLKVANDTFGHQIGDAVLMKVAETLSRDGATVGRYGGDEFVVVIPGADRSAAERYCAEVLKNLAAAGLTDPMTGAAVPVVASIGIAIYPEEAQTVEDLIRLSDSAMYQSRRQRPAGDGNPLARPLGGDRAARMVGELVPLLTSPGNLRDKLRLVAHRLSVGAGYDAVNFVLAFENETGIASSSFARVPDAFLEQWNNHRRSPRNQEIASILSRTRRPLIIDDVQIDERLDREERDLLASVGLRSALVAPMIWENTLIGILTVASMRTGSFTVRDAEFVAAVATQVTAIVQMSSLVERLRASAEQLRLSQEGTVLMLASAAEAHDSTTGRHLQRVRVISEALARELGYDEDAAHALGLAAILHDIGKIRVPDSVLGSARSLQEAEWVLMKQHTIWGGAFLAGQPGFELAATVARHHHERWDGAGYPDGLSGAQIPEAALITAVADSLDAMTSNRPYRNGRPLDDAVDEIVRCSGSQFSPRVVEALLRLRDRGALDFAVLDHECEDDHHAARAA